jgi:LysM repeat protein
MPFLVFLQSNLPFPSPLWSSTCYHSPFQITGAVSQPGPLSSADLAIVNPHNRWYNLGQQRRDAMDYDELDSLEPQDAEYLDVDYPGDDEGPELPGEVTHVTVGLSWQQVAFIISINAILSLIISLAVVIIAGPNFFPQPPEVAAPPVAATEPPPAATTGGEPGQAQPSLDTPTSPPGVTTIPTAQPVPAESTSPGTPVEPTIYIVQPGDTLGSIASKFEVSLEDLMRANGLSDPDYVIVGQELLIPIGGLPSATPTFTPVPVPTDTPLPFNPPTPLPSGTAPPAEPAATVGPTPTAVPTLTSASVAEIRLVLQVLNPGDLANEMVQIVNQGPFVRLTGWTLSDGAGNVYTFPDFSLWGGGLINVHTTSGSDTTTDLYWGQPTPVWDTGELVTLSDADGAVIATSTAPAP